MSGDNIKKGNKTAKAKKGKVQVTPKGYAYIQSTFNNTMITITNLQGDTVAWASAGSVGFKGSKKNTPYAATKAAHQCAEEAMKRGLAEVIVRVTGLGNRKPPIRGLLERNLKITAIQDRTPVRHNGCRAPGKRHS